MSPTIGLLQQTGLYSTKIGLWQRNDESVFVAELIIDNDGAVTAELNDDGSEMTLLSKKNIDFSF